MGRYTATNLPPTSIRLVVLGDRNVGKSALVVRFLTKRFIGEYASGMEFTYQKEVNMLGNKVMTEICDGVMKKDSQNYLRKLSGTVEACLLVYNVCSRASFNYACQLAKEVKAFRLKSPAGENIPLLLVGNKSDLNHFREVKQSEGENFAKSITMCHFVETSAAESYSEVERVFRLIFQLVRAYSERTSSPPSVGSARVGRKNSWSQVAQMIRDHYKKQHGLANPLPFGSSPERPNALNGDEAISCDKNNNSTKATPSKRRLRKNSTLGFTHTPLENEKLKSRCASLTKLNEDINQNEALKTPQKSKSRNLTLNSDSSDVITTANRRDSMKMSQSSDDTVELSDFSIHDEDAFLSETPDSPFTKTQKSNSLSRSKSFAKKTESNGSVRKTSINKKNLKICIYSDDDCNGNSNKIEDLPPKSAPIFRSNNSNRYRFFPNGNPEISESLKTSSSSPCHSNSGLTTFSENGFYNGLKCLRDQEKKSPSHNFLKQFFKGTLHNSFASRALGSNHGLHHSVSYPNVDTATYNGNEFSKNTLSSIDEHGSVDKPQQRIMSSRNSSTSLSSMSNEDMESECPLPYSNPSSPIGPKNAQSKTRRTSIREAVGGFIRKRKQSVTSDCSKQSKERFL